MFARSHRARERGQVLVIFARLVPVLLGMAALAVDVGSYAGHKRALQNEADSIALAAAQDLPNAAAAQLTAQTYATKYGLNWSDVTFSVVPQGAGHPNPEVRVDVTRPHPFALIRLLGVTSANVRSHASAIKTSPGGGAHLTPWAVLASTVSTSQPGTTITLKYDATNSTTGNFGAIQIDGSGASTYRTSVENGSTTTACAQGVTTCTSTSPVCSSGTCPSETGNMVGPTRTAVDDIMANTDPHCDTFAEVFSGPSGGPYTLNHQCNPWLSGSYASPRVIILPVITSLCNGNCDLTVVSFALFWLEGYQGSQCTGNSCLIQGRFINADLTVDAVAGVYSASSLIHFTRLSE